MQDSTSEPIPLSSKNSNDTTELQLISNGMNNPPSAYNFDDSREYLAQQENKYNIAEARANGSNDGQELPTGIASLVSLENAYISEQEISDFNQELLKVKTDMEEAFEEEQSARVFYSGITVSITTGIVVWALRAGSLLLTMLSLLPLWKGFDPLPVLVRRDRKKDKDKEKKDQRDEDRNRKEVGYLFDVQSSES